MKKCPQCHRAYSDVVDVCPQCNISLSGNAVTPNSYNAQINQQKDYQMNQQKDYQMNQQMNPQMNRQMNPQMNQQMNRQMNQQMNQQMYNNYNQSKHQTNTNYVTPPSNSSMGFMEVILSCFKKYVDFNGRARRKEYWFFTLFTNVVTYLLLFLGSQSEAIYILSMVWSLAIILPALAVSVRRLHDVGKKGTYMLWMLVPIVGSFIVLYALIQDSEPGANMYGYCPK